MKTQLFKILHISITMLFLAACSDSRQPEILDDTPDVPIDIVVSRSTTEQNGDNALATRFTEGCEIGISVKGRPEYQNMKYKYPANGTKLEAVDGTIYCGAQSTIEAYYPYREGGDYTHANVNAEQAYESGYYGSDALYATGTLNGNKVLNLEFKHRMAKVVFKLNQQIDYLHILNQSLSTEATTGSQKIYTYPKASKEEWSAFIVPEQKTLEIRIETRLDNIDFQYFKAVFNISSPIVAGRQYTFKIDKFRRKDGKVWMNLDNENIMINDNDTYWITTKSSNGPTPNYIQIDGGNPTVHLVGLDMTSYHPIRVEGGNPTFIIEGENIITSNFEGRTAIGGEKGCPIVIRGVNSGSRLIVKGGNGGSAIGSGQGGGCGDITIENCYVKAEAGDKPFDNNRTGGAGIGSAVRSGCGNINIKNSTIDAIGAGGGAAIGSGRSGKCKNITIENSIITAKSGNFNAAFAAVIGAGGTSSPNDAECGDITITLKKEDSQTDFLNRLTPFGDCNKVGKGDNNPFTKCGTVTWYDANGNKIE